MTAPAISRKVSCRHFGTCGGCDFQDIPYPEQLKTKEALVKGLFEGLGIEEIEDIIPSPETFHYRNKMEFAVSGSDEGVRIGLRQKKRFHRIIGLEECAIFFDGVAGVFTTFKSWMVKNNIEPYHLRRHTGAVRYAAMRHSKRYNELMVTAVFNQRPHAVDELADALKKFPVIRSIYMCVNSGLADVSVAGQTELLYGEKHIRESINGIDYLIGPDSFFQTNPYCCDKLYGAVKNSVSGIGGDALDMCCGSGGITLQIADDFNRVTGVDISEKNIENAALNACINKKQNVEFICADAEKFAAPERFSVIVLDPPRAGLGKKAKKYVLGSGVEHVAYVSCNPANLAKDLAELKEAYRVKRIIPVDMFPHTRHLEVIAILKRDKV